MVATSVRSNCPKFRNHNGQKKDDFEKWLKRTIRWYRAWNHKSDQNDSEFLKRLGTIQQTADHLRNLIKESDTFSKIILLDSSLIKGRSGTKDPDILSVRREMITGKYMAADYIYGHITMISSIAEEACSKTGRSQNARKSHANEVTHKILEYIQANRPDLLCRNSAPSRDLKCPPDLIAFASDVYCAAIPEDRFRKDQTKMLRGKSTIKKRLRQGALILNHC